MLLAANVTYAACVTNSCVDVYVTMLYTHSDAGWVYIGTDGDEPLLDCTPVSNKFLTLLTTDANFDAVYSTLLAAQLADKKVGIRILNGSNGCTVTYVTLERQ